VISKHAIVTSVFGDDYERISAVSLPTIEAFAKRCDAELLVIRRRMYPHLHIHWEKFQVAQFLKLFERVCWMDADIIMNPKAPSIFEIADCDKFAAFEEGLVFVDRADQMAVDAKHYGIPITPKPFSYFNAGVMVFGRPHMGAFMFPSKTPLAGPMSEQHYTNLQVMRLKLPFQNLTSRWNGLHSIHAPGHRGELWSVHYAGYPKTADWVSKVIAEMKVDLAGFRQFSG
jgi:hypothetical protein